GAAALGDIGTHVPADAAEWKDALGSLLLERTLVLVRDSAYAVENIDVTVIKDGFHGDTSRMFMVGKPSVMGQRVSQVAHDAMYLGIELVRPGVRLGDIGEVIQRHVETHNCSVVREYCGHGIGREFHEDPQVLHYGKSGSGLELRAGMTFTIEPMVNAGRRHVRLLPDGWTVVTKDHSLSAQWEHTVLVTDNGYEIMTRDHSGD
ncbi:MAG: type I methionyl aminopeptidase, partial [Proteobacteria bacterium]|nr:type I methionyl aminopeptidase [Pseudomonadota bacterium]